MVSPFGRRLDRACVGATWARRGGERFSDRPAVQRGLSTVGFAARAYGGRFSIINRPVTGYGSVGTGALTFQSAD